MQVPPILQVPPALFQESAFSSYKTGKPSPKKFKCPHVGCDRSFAKSDHLRTHVRTHTGERPFRCTHEECHKEFSDLANLKRHMRVHTGERPFTCPETGCGKQFSVSSNLKQHMRVHTGERPYSCPICGKAFGHVSSRRKHMNIHEGSTFKSLLDKRTTAEQMRKINPHSALNVARWRSNHLVRRDQVQPLIRQMVRRPSSRGSESSYESTSPTSYPTMPLPGQSTGNLPVSNSAGIYQISQGLDPLAAATAAPYPSHFTFRQEHHRMFQERQPMYRQTDKPPRVQLRKEVSRPKPCYPGEQGPAKENTNTLNMMTQERPADQRQDRPTDTRQHSPPNGSPLHRSPINKTLKPEPMETEEGGKRNQALKNLTKESVISAGRIAIARCAGFNNAMELGRYVTVAMDTSYKIASLAIFLHHNACRIKPRQVPVRTIQ